MSALAELALRAPGWSRPRHAAVAAAMRTAVLAALLVQAPLPARAEMRVQGSREAVRIEANQASLPELLAQLAPLGLRYRLKGAPDRPISGTYDGPLTQVLVRLLQQHGYSFVVTRAPDIITLDVVGLAPPAPDVFVREFAGAAPAVALDAGPRKPQAR